MIVRSLATALFILVSFSVNLPAQVAGTNTAANTAAPAVAKSPKLVVTPDHANGVYGPNEKVTWTVDVVGDRAGLTALTYTVKEDGQTDVATGKLDLSSGPGTITASLGVPGVLLAQIFPTSATVGGSKELALGGAVIAPDKIEPSAPAPADFDDFWQAKLKELAAVPINPALEKIDAGAAGIDYYKVTLDNIRGTHVRGQLARPSKDGKYPAMLVVQWAGVYPLDRNWAIAAARSGWLVLNISAHDEPIDQPPDFYKQLSQTTLKSYTAIGCEDRENSYFLRMFLGDVRAVNYLLSRPDWDGRTLLVTGTSQGGLQSFVTAGLCPQVTAMAANVPAGCDVYGPLATPPRAMAWPSWLSPGALKGHDPKKVQATAGYFDAINFAARVRCPALVSAGLIDETARPTGVIAAYNQIKAPKDLLIMPLSNHHGDGGAQNVMQEHVEAWKKALAAGQPPPIPASP